MKTVKQIAAQGDVIFRKVASVPAGYEETEDLVVAHSETGHHHVASGNITRYVSPEDVMVSFIVAKGPVKIEHHRPWDTHEALELLQDGGGDTTWEIRRQREHTPEGWRRVED
jgi:hypothetical protein